jgi:hypothetical protein
MSTPQDLINAALREGRIIAPDEGPSTAESQDALLALNQLLDSLSAQVAPVFSLTRETFPLTGAASYTIGTGAAFNTTRPAKIESAAVNASGVVRTVNLATVEEWNSYTDKNRTGTFADLLWYDNNYPTATIWLIPKPLTGGSLEIYSYKPLTKFATLADTVSLPEGYERALIHLLAVELWPQFRQGDPPQSLMALAADAKTSIVGRNTAILGPPSAVTQPPTPPISAPVTPAAQ